MEPKVNGLVMREGKDREGKGQVEALEKWEKLWKPLKSGKKDYWVFYARLGVIQPKLPGYPQGLSQSYLITVSCRKQRVIWWGSGHTVLKYGTLEY